MQTTASFLRSTLIMLAIGILVLVAIVASSLWLVHQNSVFSETTAELRRIRSNTVDLLATVQDAETGQRGFLLSGNAAYLVPYDKAVIDLPQRRQKLADATASRPEYAARLPELNGLLDQKMAELKTTVDLGRSGRMPEALAIVRSNDGQEDMRRIRDLLGDFQGLTDTRLRVIVADQLAAAANLQWTTIGGALAILLVLGGSVGIIYQHVRDLSRAREEVSALNAGLEARVDERTQDLMRANQEIQRFAYIVTHDLRAPLVNIMGFLSELETSVKAVSTYVLADDKALSPDAIRQARLAVEEDLPEAVSFIRSSTRKMDSLINAILKISRDGRRKLQAERIDLKAMIDTTAASVHHQIVASGGEVTISAKVKDIVTDRFSLDQILGNLLDNAVKYQMPGRPLRLSVHAGPDGRGRIRIDVKDNGRGVEKHDHERIFELFRRAGDQDQQGEGIGLAYVRSLIRNLGGDITLESEPNIGSTFILNLPADLTKIIRSSDI